MKRKRRPLKKNLKKNLKNSPDIILKVLAPELGIDWGDLYAYIRGRKQHTMKKIEDKELTIKDLDKFLRGLANSKAGIRRKLLAMKKFLDLNTILTKKEDSENNVG